MNRDNAVEGFATKLLLGINFDVQTDLRMIATEAKEADQNNSLQADDGPNCIEYDEVAEVNSVQYSVMSESEDDDDVVSVRSAISIVGDAGFEL